MAKSGTAAYYALDGNADTGCMANSQSSGLYWLFYSKTPVKITQMTINQNGNGNNEMNGGNIVASKDNTT